MMDVEEQQRLRSRVRMQRHRNHSSDDVRALRRQADRERKRAARQQATESRWSQRVSARGLICACVYLVRCKKKLMNLQSMYHGLTKTHLTLMHLFCMRSKFALTSTHFQVSFMWLMEHIRGAQPQVLCISEV